MSLHAASVTDAATTADNSPESAPVTRTTFHDLGLSDLLLRAIEEKGYLHPTPIQEARCWAEAWAVCLRVVLPICLQHRAFEAVSDLIGSHVIGAT